MDGITVYGIDICFFMVVEDAVAPKGSDSYNMSVCKDIPGMQKQNTLANNPRLVTISCDTS